MGKLIELLNEYDSGWDYDEYYGPYQYGQDRDAYKYGKYYLVSRDYGFIKWLVENDKIDRDRCECRQLYNALKRSEDMHGDKNFSRCERIIMLLAIQENPIDFLCSILK